MKRIILIALTILAVSSTLSAQKNDDKPFLKKFATGIDVFSDIVMDAPEGVDFRTINQGANVYGLYTYPIKESNFAFAIGAGVGMHNLFSNSMLSDSSSSSFLIPIPDSVDYKKSKISLTYLDVPLELRFKNESGFRFAIGVKVGFKLNAHTKYKGDDSEGDLIRVKETGLPNFETWRVGPTFQIGYKWVNLTGFYSVTKIFKSNSGIDIYPVSIGLSLRPF